MVILNHCSLSLEDGNGDLGLLVLVCGESLGLLSWDGGTSLDDGAHNSSNSLNTKGKWCNINEKNSTSLVSGLSSEDTSLDGGTISDSLIWVNSTVWLFSIEEVFDELLDLWNTGGSSDKNNLVNFGLLKTRVFDDSLDWLEGVLKEIVTELLELGTCQILFEVNSIDKSLNVDLDALDT